LRLGGELWKGVVLGMRGVITAGGITTRKITERQSVWSVPPPSAGAGKLMPAFSGKAWAKGKGANPPKEGG
jgi:hypothetical protein